MTLNPITAELVASSLIYASEEMGIALREAAYSSNIKERLDHSCALFDARGRLIAQAEHIPVHLGSLPWGLWRTLTWLAEHGRPIVPGEMIVVNHPYLSGTHLNDVTVIRAMYRDDCLIGYVVNKAHHTDLGGSVPGSMPPDARDLFAEGFIMPPTVLVRDDCIVDATVELLRANSRTPDARTGDIRAQVAANNVGERRFLELVERYGIEIVEAAIEKALDDGERRTRATLRDFPDGVVEQQEVLEDECGDPSIVLCVRLEKHGDCLTLDYTGTAQQREMPLNAVYGVTLSGVYYAIRAVTDPRIPMNDGSFRPIDVRVPEGTILNPRPPAPVSAGNVETSMRNADLVLSALAQLAPGRIPAQSGGSMNNVMIGGTDLAGKSWTFYETNGCGMGARPYADGIDAIHAHMTNTLNTPIEVIERELPLLVTRYEFAPASAGAGQYRGGSGLIRAFMLREGTATVSLLAERHVARPRGIEGGEDGAAGRHLLVTADGKEQALPAKTTIVLHPGDTVVLYTAGGGGYGREADRDTAARERDIADEVTVACSERRPGAAPL